jgi:GNAT superfamily N-acetyltransferase
MIRQRRIRIHDDKQLILEFHCRTNYESDSPWARKVPYDQYREKWFSTSQPEDFYSYLAETTREPRTMAEIWFDDETDQVAGYLWVVFNDIPDYGLSVAEINDLLVAPEFQRRGVGTRMLEYIEKKAKEKGANLLRSETGIENLASRKLHEKFGFHEYRILFEKKLD